MCQGLHELFRDPALPRHRFPFDGGEMPMNGIYVLFEEGEAGHGGERIVRIGTHTGEGQLRSRLAQHFLTANKDRSIFRKNIGRAMLRRDGDSYLEVWQIDFTTRAKREAFGQRRDEAHQARIEEQVSAYIRERFAFVVFELAEKADRLHWEELLIATVAACPNCGPSEDWLGTHSPVAKIRDGGLWLVQGLKGQVMGGADLQTLRKLVRRG